MLMSEVIEMVRGFVGGCEVEEIRELKKELMDVLKIEKGEGRKEEVLNILRSEGKISILEISKKLNISAKNVSSQLCYLKKDGIKIGTSSDGRKFIEE
jgi:biotin operon repressor